MIPSPAHDQNRRFPQVYWMGGSPCSGKSSIAARLVEEFDFFYYNCDEAFTRHRQNIQPETQPVIFYFNQLTSEELWITRPVEQQVREELAFYREEFPMILADLAALPAGKPILAEGAALLPELVAPLLDDLHRAIWIVPTAEFQVEHYSRREWWHAVVKETSDPARAFDHWMQRDIRFALEVRRQTEERKLCVLVVDGSQSIEANTRAVRKYYQLHS